MIAQLLQNFKTVLPNVDFWSLRFVDSQYQRIMVRQDKPEPISLNHSQGVHITLIVDGGIGYAATCDLSPDGLKHAINQAIHWAKFSADYSLIESRYYPRPQRSGLWQSQIDTEWKTTPISDKINLLTDICQSLHTNDSIVDWWTSLNFSQTTSILITEDIEIEQRFSRLLAMMSALANQGVESQQRSFGLEHSAQVGLEHLAQIEFADQARRVSEQAQQLLEAPDCPAGQRDLLLMPSQMTLQIHESIGHPLELDRILGDERNYAGTSFVTQDMFGSYQYGSKLLNIIFDPENPQQIASYSFDDEGTPAQPHYLIEKGRLQRPLAGHLSQQRADLPGVANSLACDWNRPAIDRMANINLVAGDSSLEQMISQTQSGILMDTNRSWSIDDSRNKFQFGCEYARLIKNGELTGVVKNPNYRGISAEFWRNLSAVGDQHSYQVLSVPACGKGEPNQAVQVGHASPACLFENVNVFGGE
jgi:predicted Zn-dependent protease